MWVWAPRYSKLKLYFHITFVFVFCIFSEIQIRNILVERILRRQLSVPYLMCALDLKLYSAHRDFHSRALCAGQESYLARVPARSLSGIVTVPSRAYSRSGLQVRRSGPCSRA